MEKMSESRVTVSVIQSGIHGTIGFRFVFDIIIV